jgi:acyl-CoA ligase (AMP-forming) (exosortase A-associated)
MAYLIQDFIFESARRAPQAPALSYQGVTLSYSALANIIKLTAGALHAFGVMRGERVAVYLEKCEEAVAGMFGAADVGAVFVPINPSLKPEQVAYILNDCNVRVLIISHTRLSQLSSVLVDCPDLHTVLVTDMTTSTEQEIAIGVRIVSWVASLGQAIPFSEKPHIDVDMAAILYTSGSTGKPKGVVLSHRNLVAGALSVSSYLNNTNEDRILCLLPLSFDYGLNQLNTAFASGACAVLMNHLLLRDIIETVVAERITGLAGVPPLWIQLSQLHWPTTSTLRYITNSGGVMPRATLDKLRAALPHTDVYLMYGLTEAFRSTFLPLDQLELRPDSIGRAIPNAEILVLRPDGSVCESGELGELVHRGALVAMGYWNDPVRTAERFKPLSARQPGLLIPEIAVWSGDTVRRDDEGYLYFVGRSDEMIKTSGYRVSPTEIEEVVYASGLVGETAAIGVAHPILGQAVVLLATASPGVVLSSAMLLQVCKGALPSYMIPIRVDIWHGALPRNPNGKIDRALLAQTLMPLFSENAQ